jgi:hypothetical protein
VARWALSWPHFARYRPFRLEPAKPKPRLSAFARAFRNAFGKALTCVNDIHDAAFIQTALGADLDEWGVKLNLPRADDEADEVYRARLLAVWADTTTGLSIAAIRGAVDAKGATYTPPLEAVAVEPYYKNRLDWPDDEDPWGGQGGLWGALELLTGHVELSRTPTPAEAAELRAEVYEVKPGPTRVRLVTPGALLGATYPPHYTLRAEAYDGSSEQLPPVILDDDFDEAPYSSSQYETFGLGVWSYPLELADGVLQGLNPPAPPWDPDGYLHKEAFVDDVYARVDMKVLTANDGYAAGLILRASALAGPPGDYYMVLIKRVAPSWRWGIVWRSGGVDTVIHAFEDLVFDPTAAYFPLEVWLEQGEFAVKLSGAVVGVDIDAGAHAAEGRVGPVIYGNDARFNNLYVW